MKKYLLIYAVVATALFAFTYRRYYAENRRLVQNQTALASEIAHYRTRSGAEAASVQALRLRCAEFETLRAADAAEIRRLGIKIRRLEAAAKAVAVTALEVRAPLRDTVVIRMRDPTLLSDTAQLFRPHDPGITAEGRSGQNPTLVQDTVRLFRAHDPEITAEGRSGQNPALVQDTVRLFRAHDPGITTEGRSGQAPALVSDTVRLFRAHDPGITTEGRSGQNPALVQDTVRLFRWRDPWVTVEGRIGRDSVVCRIRSVDTLRQVVHRIPRRFLFIRWGTKALRQEIVSTNPHTRIVHAEYVKIER